MDDTDVRRDLQSYLVQSTTRSLASREDPDRVLFRQLRKWCPLGLAGCGLATMAFTYLMVCNAQGSPYHCTLEEMPTMSYAAYWGPVGPVFGLGMAVTALFCGATSLLFGMYFQQAMLPVLLTVLHVRVSRLQMGCGIISSASLFGLAIFNMKFHHDIHLYSAVTFFIFNWLQMCFTQLCIHYLSISRSTKERTLKHAKDEIAELVSWSFFMVGNSAVLLFGVLYVLVNVMDVKGYTGWEAVFENLAVAAQLLFMGSLAAHMEEDPIIEDGLPFLNFYQPSPRPF
mmetsp:Transcript_7164/g.13354  ORF Transcript_7164/g.13354 Transcript_7164/m.13354 type:complete len:285 (+) Transcript_7164:368-1222(+)